MARHLTGSRVPFPVNVIHAPVAEGDFVGQDAVFEVVLDAQSHVFEQDEPAQQLASTNTPRSLSQSTAVVQIHRALSAN